MGDEEPERNGGGVPNTFGNALAWQWARDMPRALRGGFLTFLYAARAIAGADGRLRGKHGPYRIKQLAQVTGSNERDTRRYLNAAIAAGVVGVEGSRGRGRTPTYSLLRSPRPDWEGAVASLKDSVQQRKAPDPPPWRDPPAAEERASVARTAESGEQATDAPTPEAGEGATDAPSGTGDRRPNSSGDRRPYNPGGTHELTHEVAGVGDQPQDARAQGSGSHEDQDDGDGPYGRCDRCTKPLVKPDRSTCSRCAYQEGTAS